MSAPIDTVFGLLVDAARKGERCPQGWQLGDRNKLVAALARAGRIRVEVWAHNWRVVEIAEGPHKGKRTLKAPCGIKPYVVIDKESKPESIHLRTRAAREAFAKVVDRRPEGSTEEDRADAARDVFAQAMRVPR